MGEPGLVLMGVVGLAFLIFISILHGRSLARNWGKPSTDLDHMGALMLVFFLGVCVFFACMIFASAQH